VGATLETKKKIVEPDVSVRCETIAHGGKIDGPMVFMNLNGVSAAEGDVRTLLS
jgi:hypothetical protein